MKKFLIKKKQKKTDIIEMSDICKLKMKTFNNKLA